MELIINFRVIVIVIVIEFLNEEVIVIVIDCCSVHIFLKDGDSRKGTICQLYVPINN